MCVSIKYLYVESVAIVIFGLKSGGSMATDGIPRSFRILFAVSFSPRPEREENEAPSVSGRAESLGPRSPSPPPPQLVKYWYVRLRLFTTDERSKAASGQRGAAPPRLRATRLIAYVSKRVATQSRFYGTYSGDFPGIVRRA